MGDISCLICQAKLTSDQFNDHLNTQHLSHLPFKCHLEFTEAQLDTLKNHQMGVGKEEMIDFWAKWTDQLNCDRIFNAARLNFMECYQTGVYSSAKDLDLFEVLAKFHSKPDGIETNLIRSDQPQVSNEISNVQSNQSESQIHQETQTEPVGVESILVQTEPISLSENTLAIAHIAEIIADPIVFHPESDPNGIHIQQATEVHPGMIESVKNQSTEPAAKRLKIDTTQQIASMAIGNQSTKIVKSNSSAMPKTPSSKTAATDVRRSITTFNRQFYQLPPTKLLPKVIELMKNQMESAQVLMDCHKLIGQYQPVMLTWVDPTLKRSLIETLLAAVKFHHRNSVVVENFCNLVAKITTDQYQFVWYVGSIDVLLAIICGEIDLTPMAKKSTLKLLAAIMRKAKGNQVDLVAEKTVVEKICESIRRQLIKSDYDDIIEVGWNCLWQICWNSAGNQKRFVSAGGIELFQRCYEKFNSHADLVVSMANLMGNLSNEESIRQDLTASESLKILWQIWGETEKTEALVNSPNLSTAVACGTSHI